MTPIAVTTHLLHNLVTASHAEGINALAVACAVTHDNRVLLLAEPGCDFIDETWQLPSGPVLPGETLTDALPRTLASVGLSIDEITGYLGHEDHPTDDETLRLFCFAVTVTDPQHICRYPHHGHQWVDSDDLPDQTEPNLAAVVQTGLTISHRPDPPLAPSLRASARGLYTAEAGTELLIAHATWLQRRDFRDNFVYQDTSLTDGTDMASIDWPAAITALNNGHLPCSHSEAHILRLAASIANGISVDLNDTLTGLDTRNTDLVSRAVVHCSGR